MFFKTTQSLLVASVVALIASPAIANDKMATGENGYKVSPPLLTVGETLYYTSGDLNPSTAGAYTPVGLLDGIGAYELDKETVRIFTNHELLHFRGNDYEVSNGQGGTFTMSGARISYFDIDKYSKDIVDGGIAYNTIYDGNGNVANDISFLSEPYASTFGGGPGDGSQLQGFSRFCSGGLVEANEFGHGRGWGYTRGLQDTIYFAGEEDGNGFNSVGGAEWALDVATGDFWQVPAMGRGAWENIVAVDTGSKRTVAFILSDDTSPFDVDNDGVREAAPLYLYVGYKQRYGNFLERNGLSNGKLFVWVSKTGETTPLDFRGKGSSLKGRWVEIDNTATGPASEDGSTGFDEYGYPTQATLWTRAESVGAFGFSRPEDVAYNPRKPSEVVLASTGVDTYAVDPNTGNGADTFGTLYTIKTNFKKMTAKVTIIYDGDEDSSRALRSPDNLDWADDGFIYAQEDEAEEDSLTGEPLFGPGASNPNEAGIVRVNPHNGGTLRVANIDRNIILDASITVQTDAVDVDAGSAGEWESSGILDVSNLFNEAPGSLFLFDVQAHGIEDQDDVNAASRINDGDLVEGGQLLFLIKEKRNRGHRYHNGW